MKAIFKKITPFQLLVILITSVTLSFFNSFALSVLNNGGWGTMKGSFTLKNIFAFCFLTIFFSFLSIVIIEISKKKYRFTKVPNIFNKVNNFFSSYKRTAIFLIIIWGFFLLPFLPVVSGWDIVGSFHEMVDTRSADFTKNIFNIYPIASYLTDGSSTMWTNQHGAFLTAFYALTLKYSWLLSKSFLPGYVFLGLFHFLFAIYAYTKAIVYCERNVQNSILKIIGLILIIFNPMIFLNTISLSKNPLFVSSFILFFVLMFEFYRNNGIVNKIWNINMFISVLIGILAVKWALYVYLIVGLLYILIYKKIALKSVIISIIFPIVLFKVSLLILVQQGVVLKDDPIESKGVQIQQVARYVHDDPSILTKDEYQKLNRIFDVDNIGNLYSPAISDPVKSSGGGNFNDDSKLGYRYRTVKKGDWKEFNKVWLDLVKRNPQIAVDATVAQVGSYLSPSQQPLADYALTMPNDVIGHGYGSLSISKWIYHFYHNKIRTKAISVVFDLFTNKYVGYILHGNFWIFILILILPVFVTSIKKLVLVMPILLQIVISMLSPLANSERYTLGILAVMPLVLIITFMNSDKNSMVTIGQEKK